MLVRIAMMCRPLNRDEAILRFPTDAADASTISHAHGQSTGTQHFREARM